MAQTLAAEIQLLHVVPPNTDNPGYGTYTGALTTILKDKARLEMDKFLANGLRETADNLKAIPTIDSFIEVGDLRSILAHHVSTKDNNLLIMGTKGSDTWWDDMLGTNASLLTRHPPCPMLIVPHRWTSNKLRNICFTTDLQDASTFQADSLLQVFDAYRPNLHFLHVQTQHKKLAGYTFDVLRKYFAGPLRSGRVTFAHRVADNVLQPITEFTVEHNCELIVMHHARRSWFSRMIAGSNTEEAVKHFQCPLLVLSTENLAAQPTQRPIKSNTIGDTA